MLSFDVLGAIFAFYAETETIIHPLETLLLVCRDWSNAALGHRALWGRLRIYISHEPSSKVWSVRLPLRLARCGSDLPLDIDLRNGLAGFDLGDNDGLDIRIRNGMDGFSWGDNDDGDDAEDDTLYPIFSCAHAEERELVNIFTEFDYEDSICACHSAARNFI